MKLNSGVVIVTFALLLLVLVLSGAGRWMVTRKNKCEYGMVVKEKTAIKVAFLQTRIQPNTGCANSGPASSFHSFLSSAFTITQFDVFHCYQSIESIPSVDHVNGYDLIVLPGASKSVNWELPWMQQVESLLADPKRRPWVLGVCFGRQLIAKAYGGVVKEHPDG